MTRCPRCNHLVVFNAGGGKLKIRTSMVLISKSGPSVAVVCRQCGDTVPLDMAAGEELTKAMADDRRLVIRPEKKP